MWMLRAGLWRGFISHGSIGNEQGERDRRPHKHLTVPTADSTLEASLNPTPL
jgi:hypothetical protein